MSRDGMSSEDMSSGKKSSDTMSCERTFSFVGIFQVVLLFRPLRSGRPFVEQGVYIRHELVCRHLMFPMVWVHYVSCARDLFTYSCSVLSDTNALLW